MRALLHAVSLWTIAAATGVSLAGGIVASCEPAKADGWCAERGVGYLAGLEIRSEMLFEALDAHGHEIDPETLECDSCKLAYVTDGYCEDHTRGWVRGLAYLSPLTYYLARGERVVPDELGCEACRAHTADHGWCAEHARGMVGNVAMRDRSEYDAAERALHTLASAQETLKRCETCAAAMVGDGRCAVCRITYVDGRPVPDPPREGRMPARP